MITLDVLPHLQQDEAQITDYGRLALNPESDWSVTWILSKEKPLLLWSFLGPLFSEMSFHLFGPSGIGPRISSIIGGMIAASLLLGWLLAKKVPSYPSLALSVSFLLDPLFALSQRIARVDSWVFAFCLGACWLLAIESNRKQNSFFIWRVFFAGGLTAIAGFTWPSAIFLYPLIAYELLRFLRIKKTFSEYLKDITILLLNFIIGAVIFSAFLVFPMWHNISIIFKDLSVVVNENINATSSNESGIIKLLDYKPILKLIKAYIKTFTPIFPILGLAGAIVFREKGLIIVTLVSIFLIFSTLVYEFRALYLLPYFILLFSLFFIEKDEGSLNIILNKASHYALFTVMFWSIFISLVVRTTLGLISKNEMDRNNIENVLSQKIGSGDYRVFLDFTYEFYFAGRALGWKLYTPYIHFTYDSQGNWLRESDHLPKENFLDLLSKMDYAIFYQGSLNQDLLDQLEESELFLNSNFEIGHNQNNWENNSSQNRILTVLRWYLQGKQHYGAYVIFARKTPCKNQLSVESF